MKKESLELLTPSGEGFRPVIGEEYIFYNQTLPDLKVWGMYGGVRIRAGRAEFACIGCGWYDTIEELDECTS